MPENSTSDPGGWMATGIAVPESSWVHFKIEGGVRYSGNRACDDLPPYWSCSYPLDGAVFGPWVRSGTVGAGIVGKDAPVWSPETPSPGSWYPANGESGNLMVREGLMYTSNGGEVYVIRHMIFEGAWNPNFNVNVPSYFYTGHQTITVERVVPLKVTAGGAVGPGNRVVGTVEPAPGMAMIAPDGRRSGVWWTYEELDDAGKHIGGAVLGQCENATTCSYEALRPGYFTVGAYVQGQLVDARSDVVGTQTCVAGQQGALASRRTCAEGDPSVSVVCSPASIVRGSSVMCEAEVTPAQSFRVLNWRAAGEGFFVLGDSGKSYGAGEHASWVGTAVASSRVQIRVEVTSLSGTSKVLTGSTAFRVTQRAWKAYEITSPAVEHRVYSPQMGVIPGSTLGGGPFGVTNLTTFLYEVAGVDSVSTGPNAGLVYLTNQPQFEGSVALISLHPAIYPPFPADYPGALWTAWYSDQNGSAGSGWHNPLPPCSQSDMPKLRQELERHEGTTLATNSHVAIANAVFRSSKLHERFERRYERNVSISEFREHVNWDYTDWYSNEYMPPQKAFDAQDTGATWNAIGCMTDNDLTPP